MNPNSIWEREVERHRCAAKRIEQLHEELDEPFEIPDELSHQVLSEP